MSKSNLVTVLNPFNLDLDAHSNAHGLSCPEESLTVQADLEQSDINYIVRVFGVTKQLPFGNDIPFYDDVTDIPTDYHSALNQIIASDAAFMQLDAIVRAKFSNDPGLFLDFINDESNYDEASSLGLVPSKLAVSVTPKADTESEAKSAQSTT
ncbi:MAG: internal scaffolding protein [Microvirus sp.]|nr:MAG: internal scaffolding protein [Microvirus sp.]